MNVAAPPVPRASICVGVTGHRATHPAMQGTLPAVVAELEQVIAIVDRAAADAAGHVPLRRLVTLLADGVDQAAADTALGRGWELACPIPFGQRLNEAVNGGVVTPEQARRVLAGEASGDAAIDAGIAAIRALGERATLLELADRDERIEALLHAHLAAPSDREAARLFAAETSRRVALAGEVLIEQSDIVIAVWDGDTLAHVGGTGHTMARALERGAPVIWIDPARPEAWRVLRAPEALAARPATEHAAGAAEELRTIVAAFVLPDAAGKGSARFDGPSSLGAERWHPRSNPLAHGYRRVEALFGDRRGAARFRSIWQTYEAPDAIAAGSAAPLLEGLAALPGGPPSMPGRIETSILRRFAWADGVSSRLSDSYRGGMVVNFLLAAFAIVGGVAYLPLVDQHYKWPFACFELVLLVTILFITHRGRTHRWHGRWFETRRVAEYLRHSPLLLILGVARAPGRWPRGTETSWPEWYARQSIREVGIPSLRVTPAYLRAALGGPIRGHVIAQRDYHFAKAARLKTVDLNLDRLADTLFLFAIISVALYLSLKLESALGLIGASTLDGYSKTFTLLGVVFPTFGSAIAGIRYFGDFERFSAISEITAEKLDAIAGRIDLLLSSPSASPDYGQVAELARATDDTVFAEIENWQSVFGGKHITIPA